MLKVMIKEIQIWRDLINGSTETVLREERFTCTEENLKEELKKRYVDCWGSDLEDLLDRKCWSTSSGGELDQDWYETLVTIEE